MQEYPVERQCSHRVERLQSSFVREAMEILPRNEETAFEVGPRGLLLLASTEMALERPVERLTEMYGDMVRISPPTVRYRRGLRTEEPYMGLRVLCSPEHYEAIREDLRVRRATILDAEVNRRFGIVRAKAPLATLIGYPTRLSQLTSGRSQLVMWLSHYEAFEDPPPGGAAA